MTKQQAQGRYWTPEQLGGLVAKGINTAVAEQRKVNAELRAELDALKAELRAVQAKQAGGVLTLAAR
ncbi:hypothetical protein [Cupriavidus taiwanensis]|uniref:Uncharacterized protein n=1 Tax=Cupriavidus taiwanensis TaxID=164546 RepID=A0A375BWC6_9BURK|nr:hypothetical protein CBM2587_A80015 [Cupriavidus taiwanensis]